MLRFLVAVLILMLAPAALAQRPQPGPASPARDGGWMVLGGGPSTGYDLGVSLSASLGRERFLRLGYHGGADICFSSGSCRGADAPYVALGVSDVDRWHRVSLAAGPTVAFGHDAGGRNRWAAPGVVVEAQAVFSPVKEFGLGMNVHLVQTPSRSLAGLSFVLVLEGHK